MTRHRALTLFIAAAALVLALIAWRRGLHFDLHALLHELRSVRWSWVALGIASIYATMLLRALRWAVLMRPLARVSARKLIAPQIIGFAAISLFGRVVDLARPALIAARTNTPVAAQVAIYSVERAFDLGAAAVLFSAALAFTPANLPHHDAFARAGIVSLIGTAALAGITLLVRLHGPRTADWLHPHIARRSTTFADAFLLRVTELAAGMNVIASAQEFLAVLAVSLVMWAMIAFAYLTSAWAFAACPQLAGFTVFTTMLLLATSMGGSLFQLPVLGWFTQISVLAAALHGFFDVPLEPATACAAVIVFVTTLAILPPGLLLARLERVSLRSPAPHA